MKEIYIVTGGSYSDYHIDSVFKDKDEAIKYAKVMQNTHGDDFRVENYSFKTEELLTVQIVKINATKFMHNDNYKFELDVLEVIDEGDNTHETDIYVNDSSGYSDIDLIRKLTRTDIDLEKLFRKIVEDYFFMVEANWNHYKEWSSRTELTNKMNELIDSELS